MKIAIIGGGSAGWITLSYLAATIDCELTIIHSNEIDPIGVGESTTPTIKHVADTVGVDEKQWMKDSQATFKYGVEFLNFNNIGSRWVHTFDDMLPHQTFHRPITENGKDLYKKELTSVDYFLKAFGKDVTHYNNTHGPQEYLIENEISPYSKSGKSNISDYPGYSYQINAFKFGESLRMHTDKSKYTEIIDTVTKLNWQGDTIQSVELNNGNKIEADVFFDCTGFKRLLIGQLGTWKHYDELINDSAIWGPIKNVNSYKPCTEAHAMPHGWIWITPTVGQLGTGYVYSSKHQSYDSALQTIKDFWTKRGHKFEPLKSVQFDNGINSNVSKSNVISNGLAQSFIEPLEATSIMVTCVTVRSFVNLYKKQLLWNSKKTKVHNRIIQKFIDHTRRFVHMHYRLSERTDTPYWREVGNDPIAVQELCDYIKVLETSTFLNKGETLLNQFNWVSLLLGYNKKYLNKLPDISDEDIENYLHYTKMIIENYKHTTRNNLTIKERLAYINT